MHTQHEARAEKAHRANLIYVHDRGIDEPLDRRRVPFAQRVPEAHGNLKPRPRVATASHASFDGRDVMR